jgi:phage terminase large subunit-like protein
MLSAKLGTEWVFTSAISAPVPLRICVVGPDLTTIRSTIIDGPYGIMNLVPGMKPLLDYAPSQNRMGFPNGTMIQFYSASNGFDRLRGTRYDLVWFAGMGSWAPSDVRDAMGILPTIYDPSYTTTSEGILATY